MDRTQDFVQVLAERRHLRRTLLTNEIVPSSSSILPTSSTTTSTSSVFFENARDIYMSLRVFERFLKLHRKRYLDHWSDQEADNEQVDQTALNYQTTCMKKLETLKLYLDRLQTTNTKRMSPDMYACQCEIVILLNHQLHRLFKYYTTMRTTRLRYQWEKQQLWIQEDQSNDAIKNIRMIPNSKPSMMEQHEEMMNLSTDPALLTSSSLSTSTIPISISALKKENTEMFEEFNDMVNEIRMTEQAIMEIAQLQSIFQSHVVQQAQEIERLYEEAIDTSEQVKGGNRHLVQARKRSSGFRKTILFLFILCTLTLLFLDWYTS
jgi:syntaxin 18